MNEAPELYRNLVPQFGGTIEPIDSLTLEDVKQFVSAQIARLLDENTSLLMSILYRIDVAEPRVQDVLKRAPHSEIPDRLADLVIERQLQKVRSKRKYGNNDREFSRPHRNDASE